MKILISGSSGLIGSAVAARLRDKQYSIGRLVRSAPMRALDVQWSTNSPLDPAKFSQFDAVIHLAGKTVAGRWSDSAKREIRESRVAGTKNIATAIAESFRKTGKPRAMISASAIGCYGDRGEEVLTEQSARGTGFLADVCREWEGATEAASKAGVRVAMPRIGLVLDSQGGALAKMLPVFRLGVAGKIGSGQQWWSWISLDDVVRVFEFALVNDLVNGPINTVAPEPVTNEQFTRTLGRVLRRPTVFTMPAFAARAAFGAAAEELILSSQRVKPAVLEKSKFTFHDRELEPALRRMLVK